MSIKVLKSAPSYGWNVGIADPSLPRREDHSNRKGNGKSLFGFLLVWLLSFTVGATQILYEFDIPSQSADTALNTYAVQAGQQVLFPFDEVKGITTNRLKGSYTAEEAIRILLKGTELKPVFNNEHGFLTVTVESRLEERGEDMNKKLTAGGVVAAFFAGMFGAPGIDAQTATRASNVLEEVVVTARKRDESMQDVPISVQAFSGDHITEQGIIDIQQLAPYTPNFSYATAPGASDLLIMRGLGTIGSGVHFEPSVGQQFNGYYSTRSRLGRSALMDLKQVEVLKGPQGVIIGRNNSLGALNITSNKPTEEFEAKFASQYNFDASEGYELDGVVSGPLMDHLRGRVAVNYRDIDGWVKNSTQPAQRFRSAKTLPGVSCWIMMSPKTSWLRSCTSVPIWTVLGKVRSLLAV